MISVSYPMWNETVGLQPLARLLTKTQGFKFFESLGADQICQPIPVCMERFQSSQMANV